ncbi:MAG: primosomal protein N' [Minisyncoccia bacterium]
MKLIGIIPISRGIAKEKLSYFSTEDFPIGSIVYVSLRSKNIPGLVVSSQDALEEKSSIKKLSFTIKKVSKKPPVELFLPNFIKTCQEEARYLATTTGAVLYSVMPSGILENLDKIEKTELTVKRKNEVGEKFVVQSDDEERYSNYKSIIREEFAKGYSVFFCLPTIQETKKAVSLLSKGIETYTFVLHSGLTKKEILKTWNKIMAEKHSVLVVMTGSFLSLPRPDIGTIIIDRESSRSYKSQHRPFLDIRCFAEKLALNYNVRLVLGDILLRTETIWRYKNNEFFELFPLKFRSLSLSSQEIIDMCPKPVEQDFVEEKDKKKIEFKIISDDLVNLIKNNQDDSEHLFIFSARRGLHPTTLCADCGTIVTCHNCKSPIVLHTASKGNFFLCHRCGERRSASEKCFKCDSWRLATLGIGSELIEKEIQKIFPDMKIFRLDADNADSHKKALQIAEKFYSSPGSILIGTEMSLPYIYEKIQNSAVISMDAFFSLPDFRINERIINIILKIKSFTSKRFILQTRKAQAKIWDYAVRGNLADFYRDEIGDRQMLSYPPYSTLIKISLLGNKDVVVGEMEKLQKEIEPHIIDIFPAFIPSKAGKYQIHGLIKVKGDDWVDEALLEKIQNLPPIFNVNVNPESLL